MEQVHRDKQDGSFNQAGGQPGGHEFAQFRQDHLFGPVVALEHKGLVGHKGEGHRHHPGNAIAYRGWQMQPVQAGQIDKIIDHRGQHAEDQIGNNVKMGLHEGHQFFFHCDFSRSFFPIIVAWTFFNCNCYFGTVSQLNIKKAEAFSKFLKTVQKSPPGKSQGLEGLLCYRRIIQSRIP